MKKTIGIVIPTYGRPEKILRTLNTLFRSEVGDIPLPIPVVVVDDGSYPPVESALKSIKVPDTFTLEYIYQTNAGPGAARNTGFKALQTDIVLFLDDDIELLPHTLYRHYTFHTRAARVPSVFYGDCPPATGHTGQLLEALPMTPSPQTHVASGHLSAPREVFPGEEAPYDATLGTPVAEEYELAFRLHKRGVPIYMDPAATGIHLVPPATLQYLARREYRHGMALGELLLKKPEVLTLPPLRKTLRRHHPYMPQISMAWLLKAISVQTRFYRLFLRVYAPFDRPIQGGHLSPLAKLITGAALMDGIKAGIHKFKLL